MKKINEGWGSLIKRDITIDIKKEDDPTERIHEFMEKHKISKKYYTINDDYSVDVVGTTINIDVEDCPGGKLPFKFNKVAGNFNCIQCELTSLEGCPNEVGMDFDCSRNHLTSLKGGPKIVYGYYCQFNMCLQCLVQQSSCQH